MSSFRAVKDAIVRRIATVHTAVYRRTGGRLGGSFGAPSLLLTVPGRKTGQPHTTPVYYLRDGDRYVVVGSYGGDHRMPQWYRNVIAAGSARIEVGKSVMEMTATLAGPAERQRLWPQLLATWPGFEVYQRNTQRELPVVVLSRPACGRKLSS
jgi:deazaflavin-dependent oxidoreductase (nitroreductase family)